MAKKLDYEKRLGHLRKELIRGVSRYDILDNLKNGRYDWYEGSEKAQRGNLLMMIREAADTCRFETAAARDEQKAIHLERYLDLYRECRDRNDRTNARAILSDIAKLMGLNEKETLAIEQTTYKVKLV